MICQKNLDSFTNERSHNHYKTMMQFTILIIKRYEDNPIGDCDAPYFREGAFSLLHDKSWNFCWRDNYKRQLKPLSECGQYEKDVDGCYKPCHKGYTRIKYTCQMKCPSGWKQVEVYKNTVCVPPVYGLKVFPRLKGEARGSDGMLRRCEEEYGKGKCLKKENIACPVCKEQYYSLPYESCQCRAKVDCELSYFGQSQRCDMRRFNYPIAPFQCTNGFVLNEGVCEQKCKQGYQGVGPICWEKIPQKWFKCLDGATIYPDLCQRVKDVGSKMSNMAVRIALYDGGDYKAIEKNTKKLTQLKGLWQELKKEVLDNKTFMNRIIKANQKFPSLKPGKYIVDLLKQDTKTTNARDILIGAAQLYLLLETKAPGQRPSAYNYVKCSDVRY